MFWSNDASGSGFCGVCGLSTAALRVRISIKAAKHDYLLDPDKQNPPNPQSLQKAFFGEV